MTELRTLRDARVDLAACYRLLALHGMSDLIYTHASLRVPGRHDEFLINPYGALWDEITASSLVIVGPDGRPRVDGGARVNPAGFTIHSAVHYARPDTACVIHTHTRAGVAVSCLDCGLLPINQIALQFEDRLGYHDYEGIALDADERARIADDLGDKDGLILRNHGLLTVGRSVAEAFNRMYYLSLACEIQLLAQSTGASLIIPDRATRARTASQTGIILVEDDDLALEWQAHLRRLDRSTPEYRA